MVGRAAATGDTAAGLALEEVAVQSRVWRRAASVMAAAAVQSRVMVRADARARRAGAAAAAPGRRDYFVPSSSTSNSSVALGGMTPPAPRAP